ncbi:MAG: ISNCY family transposase [Thermoguttaceae bacterium]
MSRKERKRLEAFSRVKTGGMTLVEASERLGLSYRQTKRAWSRYQSEGDAGLVHRLRGRGPNRHSPEKTKQRSLALYREQYADYGATLAAECLGKEDGVQVSVTTLRRWLLQAGLLDRRRKRRQHRRRRTRREHLGELVQMDGSFHDWFEGRRDWATLMVMIDDATGMVTARFYENESWASSSDSFQRYARRHGLPRGLYVDQHSIYRPDGEPTDADLLDDCRPETQFGRAMRELDVELILARSPQAKGRVERMNGTLQDRLVKALRRAKISDVEAANRFLEDIFLAEFNAQFKVAAVGAEDWHRPLSATTDLARIVSIQESRVVAKDWTLRWWNRILQLPRETAEFIRSGQRVTVCEPLDGVLRVFAGRREVPWSPILDPPLPKRAKRTGPTGSSQGQKPAANHPWRRRRPAATRPEPSVPLPPPAKKMAGSTSARCARLVEPAILG